MGNPSREGARLYKYHLTEHDFGESCRWAPPCTPVEPEPANTDAVARAMAVISTASGENCLCHDTPLDNCLDIEQAITEALAQEREAGRAEGRASLTRPVRRRPDMVIDHE